MNLTAATTDNEIAYKDVVYVVSSTPTNYYPDKNYFDTSSAEIVIQNDLSINPDAVMVTA